MCINMVLTFKFVYGIPKCDHFQQLLSLLLSVFKFQFQVNFVTNLNLDALSHLVTPL